MRVKVTERSALVGVAARRSSSRLTRARAGRPAWRWRAARAGDGEEAQSRLLGLAGGPRVVRDADRRRRVPRGRRVVAGGLRAGAVAGSWSARPDHDRPVSAPLQPGPHPPARARARRAVYARASSPRAGDGDARSGRDPGRASRAGRLAPGHPRHLCRRDCLASAALFCRRNRRVAAREAAPRRRSRLERRRRFLGQCMRRVPAGARVFLRADEGFWGQHFFAECERRRISYAVGAPQIGS